MSDPQFNLVYDRWIPVVGRDRVSLLELFSDDSLSDLSGNAIQKIALLKLFIAIAQASVRLVDEEAWRTAGPDGLAEAAVNYLKDHEDCFSLYGDRPFLQMPVLADIKDAKVQEIYYVHLPDLASENDSILRELQDKAELEDADKAVFIIQLMNYAPGGKRTSYIGPLSKGFSGKTKNANAGPSLGGSNGYLQTCLKGRSLMETVWLNYFTDHDLLSLNKGINLEARPPWEKMPAGEDDDIAQSIQDSVYAWLVAVSRFVLLTGNGIKYTEGLQYPKLKDGYYEPFITIRRKDRAALYSDPAKKPWRSLVALLQSTYDSASEYSCDILRLFIPRTREAVPYFSIWSGGLRLRATSGDQSVKQDDDYVESEVEFASELFDSTAFSRLSDTMSRIDGYASGLRTSIGKYCDDMNSSGIDIPSKGLTVFWLAVEPLSYKIIDTCMKGNSEDTDVILQSVRKIAIDVYNEICPHETARQILAWMKDKPFRGGYTIVQKR